MDKLFLDANVVVDFLCEHRDDFYLANDPLPNQPPNWWPIRIQELGQQVVDEIRHQAGDGLGAAIRQQVADEESQQAADQLEMPDIFYVTAVDELLRGESDNLERLS